MKTLLILVPALPLAAALGVGLLGRLLRHRAHLPVVAALAASFVCSALLLAEVHRAANAAGDGASGGAANTAWAITTVGFEQVFDLWTWVAVNEAYDPAPDVAPQAAAQPHPPAFDIGVTLRADPLTCVMLTMVTLISLLVAIYSIGYMHDDPGYPRFFAFVSLFVFSMTMLVSVSNFVMLYVFWEAVGACSYFLIGFWFQKPEAAAAGKKAFLVNRVGDFGFALGLFLLWTTYGTLNFHDTWAADGALQAAGVLGQTRLADPTLFVGGGVGLAICLLLLTGACGKSAQFPLHVWLPDAMEGPTPVSALIHAATMVTAGVYMVIRCTPLFMASVDAQHVVALVGGFTALLAGAIALTQTDLKRVLAYSTVSQLGYMFLSLGAATMLGITSGMFHLITHACFKALLFLGAGSVMHAMGGVIDVRRFGGLRRLMPITMVTFLIGAFALAGLAPFAGFWSKDEIFVALHDRGQDEGLLGVLGVPGLSEGSFYLALYWTAVATAGLTAFYTFRAFFLTFFGPERIPPEAGHHAHESPRAMTIPLVILAVLSAGVGAYFALTHQLVDFLRLTPSLAYGPVAATAVEPVFHGDIAAVSTVVVVVGIALAAFLYLGSDAQVVWLTRLLKPAYLLSYGKFFFDQIYHAFIVLPLEALARLSYWVDRWIIDALVNLVGRAPAAVGAMLRSLQGGLVQFYALAMVLGLLVLIGALVMWPGG